MAGIDWIALGDDEGRVRGYAISGTQVVARADGASDEAVLRDLDVGNAKTIRIGAGPPDTVPCAVLPKAGPTLSVVTQDAPAGVFGGWVRVALAGVLTQNPNWDGVVVVTDHDVTHWIHLSADEVVSFSSFLTLRLMRALGGEATPDLAAVSESQSRPERLAAHLRQADVTGRKDAITGHLIGAELAASRVYWLGQDVIFLSSDAEAGNYGAALEDQGVPVRVLSLEDTIAAGLGACADANLPGAL